MVLLTLRVEDLLLLPLPLGVPVIKLEENSVLLLLVLLGSSLVDDDELAALELSLIDEGSWLLPLDSSLEDDSKLNVSLLLLVSSLEDDSELLLELDELLLVDSSLDELLLLDSELEDDSELNVLLLVLVLLWLLVLLPVESFESRVTFNNGKQPAKYKHDPPAA